jgi:hypothetical protein
MQLRAVRYTATVAALLRRRLVRPSIACYCDRDPSAKVGGLLPNGCQLPSSEGSLSHLPFRCPLEQIIDEQAWRRAVAVAPSAGSYPLVPELYHPPPAGLLGASQASTASVTVQPGETPHQLSARIEATLSSGAGKSPPRLVEIHWPLPMDEPQHPQKPSPPGMAPEEAPIDRLLAGGPRGGWCAACPAAEHPSLSRLRHIGSFGRDHFCLNFTRLLHPVPELLRPPTPRPATLTAH